MNTLRCPSGAVCLCTSKTAEEFVHLSDAEESGLSTSPAPKTVREVFIYAFPAPEKHINTSAVLGAGEAYKYFSGAGEEAHPVFSYLL